MDTERRRIHGYREKKETWIQREVGDMDTEREEGYMDTERRRRHGYREK